MENEILKIAKRIQALAQTGLRFTKDIFDRQRYEELRELSVQLASQISDAPLAKIRELFTAETGFQTPKIDIRAVVLKDNKVLLVQERSDHKWALPGGYADVNYSPSAMAEKEIFEETGLHAKSNRILAVLDSNKHNFPPLEFHFYKLVILCELIDGELRGSEETLQAVFFDFDRLPDLSVQRNNKEMFDIIREALKSNKTYMD